MNNLERTKQGNFHLEGANSLSDIESDNYINYKIEDVVDLNVIMINDDKLYKKVINGNTLFDNYNGYILYKKDNNNIALYKYIDGVGKIIILY